VVRVGDKIIFLRFGSARKHQCAYHACQQSQNFEASSKQGTSPIKAIPF
jgi:hypothetical protein